MPRYFLIKSILDQGININHVFSEENSNWPSLQGKTALQVAAATTSDVDVIQLLLDCGADRTILDSSGNTLAESAIKNEHFDAADVLQDDQ